MLTRDWYLAVHKEVPRTAWDKSDSRPYDFVDVQWLNEAIHREPAISYVTYGNNAEGALAYSRLAILAVVPPFLERGDRDRREGRHVEWSDMMD